MVLSFVICRAILALLLSSVPMFVDLIEEMQHGLNVDILLTRPPHQVTNEA